MTIVVDVCKNICTEVWFAKKYIQPNNEIIIKAIFNEIKQIKDSDSYFVSVKFPPPIISINADNFLENRSEDITSNLVKLFSKLVHVTGKYSLNGYIYLFEENDIILESIYVIDDDTVESNVLNIYNFVYQNCKIKLTINWGSVSHCHNFPNFDYKSIFKSIFK